MATAIFTPPRTTTTDPTGHQPVPPGRLRAVTTLAGRRLALSARTPREVLVPLLTPVLFALVIAPALADTIGRRPGSIDYLSYAALATIGLLVPLSCMTAGLGVVVDRLSGARRDLLAAPIPRSLVVVGNLAVAVLLSALQLGVLLGASVLRGADLHLRSTGVLWFAAAVLAFTVAMYGVAEVVANRVPSQEEYVGALPPIAIVPWFFAGSLFPISALPAGLAAFAKVLPITHLLALLRYGVLDGSGAGLKDIWGMSNTTVMATLSFTVVLAFAALMSSLAVRTFTRAAVD